MIVTRGHLQMAMEDIYNCDLRGFDSETYGLRYQDRMFSFIVSTGTDNYYFNFNGARDHLGYAPPANMVLDRKEVFDLMKPAFARGIWAAHNAGFDLQKIRFEGYYGPARTHCTLATERVLRNDFLEYSLGSVAPRYGFEKSKAVDDYISEHKLVTRAMIPGKKKVSFLKHFDLVPLGVMVEYGENDAYIHRRIAETQRAALGLGKRDETLANIGQDERPWNTN